MTGTEDERIAADLLKQALEALDRAGQLYVAAMVSSAIDNLCQRVQNASQA